MWSLRERLIIAITGGIVSVTGVTLGIILDIKLHVDAPLCVASAAVGIVTFTTVLVLRMHDKEPMTEASVRLSIATMVVSSYVTMVCIAAFFPLTKVEDKLRLAPLTDKLVPSFTSVVNLVMGFYFGSSALVEGAKILKGNKEISPPS